MSEFDVFADYYELDLGGFLEDLPMYAGYAARMGGPLLELGCGAGRLLLPLAEAGHTITGVDLSPAMLTLAERRLTTAACRERVTLVEDDMRSLGRLSAARYRLAFCAINSFLHLPDAAAQQAALTAVRRCLEPDGLLILDVFHPHPDLLVDYDGRLVHEATLIDESGARVDKFASRLLEAATQTVHTVFFYDRLGSDGATRRTAAPFTMRYMHRYELELRLIVAGFELLDLFGDYDLKPFDSDSLHMIAIAQPQEE